MTSTELVVAVCEWAHEVVPELTGTYPYSPMQKDEELPDAVVELLRSLMVYDDDEFTLLGLQQVMLLRHELSVSFMIDNDSPAVAADSLRGWADRLRASVLSDGTLGERVPVTSPFLTFDYTPPFVEYADGTRGREMTMNMTVAEPLEVGE